MTSLPKTNSLHLKHWGWKMSFLFGAFRPIFSEHVSFREGRLRFFDVVIPTNKNSEMSQGLASFLHEMLGSPFISRCHLLSECVFFECSR